ncbi:MAG TPA: DUF1707 domain-containing protein [Streptosporangiaceae bacterium]|nr:DUF1707 domain-containing protein [Streptosporangiaceae bacterium]
MGGEPDDVLASDDEREAVVARLADGCAQGRLTLQELTARAAHPRSLGRAAGRPAR